MKNLNKWWLILIIAGFLLLLISVGISFYEANFQNNDFNIIIDQFESNKLINDKLIEINV